jgi:AcrR family transcriptional regulator
MEPLPKLTTKKEVVAAFRTQEILAAAQRLMESRGLEALTMEEIATAAGVAKGTVYLYFQSKEDLLQALMSQVGENLLQDLEALLQGPGSPPERLKRVVALLLRYLERERVLFPVYARDLLKGDRPGRKGRWLHIQALEERFVTLLTGLFAQGIEAGQFIPANPRLLTFLFRGLIRAVGYYQMAEAPKDTLTEVLPVLLHFLFSGLARQAPVPQEVAAP